MLNPNKNLEARAKNIALQILNTLNITVLDRENLYKLQMHLDTLVSSLVTQKECEGQMIDEELLEIYDWLVDFILDNENNLDALNDFLLLKS